LAYCYLPHLLVAIGQLYQNPWTTIHTPDIELLRQSHQGNISHFNKHLRYTM